MLRILLCLFIVSSAHAQFGVGVRDETPALTTAQTAVLDCLSVVGTRLVVSGTCGELSVDSVTDEAGTGPVVLAEGATIPTGQTLTVGNIKGISGSTLTIAAGDTAGDDVVIAEGSGDGGNNRLTILGGSALNLLDPAGANAFAIDATTSYVYKNLDVGFTSGGNVKMRGYLDMASIATPAAPDNGYARIYAETDNTLGVVDQAGATATIDMTPDAGALDWTL